MKKFIFFVSTIFFSLFLVNNKIYAQELPDITMKVEYIDYYFERTNQNTYEYHVTYGIENIIIENLEEDEYYLIIDMFIPYKKGIDRRTNSYELYEVIPFDPYYTHFIIQMTILKTIIDDDYNGNVDQFLSESVTLYIKYDSNEYDIGYNDGYSDGFNDGRDLGNYEGYNDGYDDGYNDGYDDGYNDGYNDINVVDFFGDRNIAKDTDINYYLVSDAFEPTTSIVVYNVGHSGSNILLDKPNIIVIIKKDIYDYVVVRFDSFLRYHYDSTYFDIGDYDIYIFDFPDRLNTKYNLEIRKENVTTTEEADKFLNDVVDNIYFSHTSKLLTSFIASQFYYFGYITGFEEMISDNEAYQIGYETGYENGYTEGDESGYERGFEAGYDQGFDYGKTVEYEHGYEDGYDDGYSDGIREPFFSNFHVWIVPAIIIIVIAGIFVGYRRERYFND